MAGKKKILCKQNFAHYHQAMIDVLESVQLYSFDWNSWIESKPYNKDYATIYVIDTAYNLSSKTNNHGYELTPIVLATAYPPNSPSWYPVALEGQFRDNLKKFLQWVNTAYNTYFKEKFKGVDYVYECDNDIWWDVCTQDKWLSKESVSMVLANPFREREAYKSVLVGRDALPSGFALPSEYPADTRYTENGDGSGVVIHGRFDVPLAMQCAVQCVFGVRAYSMDLYTEGEEVYCKTYKLVPKAEALAETLQLHHLN